MHSECFHDFEANAVALSNHPNKSDLKGNKIYTFVSIVNHTIFYSTHVNKHREISITRLHTDDIWKKTGCRLSLFDKQSEPRLIKLFLLKKINSLISFSKTDTVYKQPQLQLSERHSTVVTIHHNNAGKKAPRSSNKQTREREIFQNNTEHSERLLITSVRWSLSWFAFLTLYLKLCA